MSTKPNTRQSQAPACSHGYTAYAGKHPNGKPCTDAASEGHTQKPLSWDDCATVANALTAAPGTGEIWRSTYGDIVGEPLSLARVAVEALADAGRLPAPHLLPLLDLTADETDALIVAAGSIAALQLGPPALRSALDKLTTTDTAEETS